MKILYYHQHFSTPRGASGNRSYMMARRLVERGHDVTVVCGLLGSADTGLSGPYHRGSRTGVVDGIRVVEYELPYSNGDSFARRTLTFVRFAIRSSLLALREDYDLIFSTTTPLTAGIPGILAKWLRSKPFVFEVRDLWPELPRAMGVIRNPIVLGMMGLLEWVSYRSADRLVGLAPGIVSGICERGVLPKNVALIPNGCDLDIFNNNAHGWRPDGVLPSDLMAVFTGSHGIANGLDAILDAAAELLRMQRADIKLVLIGSGMQKQRLIERATRDRLTNVVFLDSVPKAQLAGLLVEADVGLQILANVPAFYRGTSPNKFFDYIASGLPVLNNYPGWLADIILEHDCGYAVAPGNAHAFAAALIEAQDNPRDRQEKGRRAREVAVSQFSRDELADRFADWIEGLSGGPRIGGK